MIRRTKIIRPILRVIIGAITSSLIVAPAMSQSTVLSEDAKTKAEWISRTIISENLVTESLSSAFQINFSGLSASEKVRKIVQYTHGTATLSNNLDTNEIINIYSEIVSKNGSNRDKVIYQLYNDYLTTVNISDVKQVSYPVFVGNLEKATQNQDWFVANRAWILLSNISSRAGNNNLALEQAQNAFKVIPNEISPYVTDARILTLEHTTYLHNLLLNPEMAIETTVELIKQRQEANQPIDGFSLLNNLVFSLSTWREYEVSTQLAKDALKLEKKFNANLPGLTEFRIGRLLNNQGAFSEALPVIESGLSVAKMPIVRKNLSLIHITALAGLGNTEIAEAELKVLEKQFPRAISNKNDVNIISARAAIAIAKGNRREAFRLTTSVNDATVQRLLTQYNSNTSDLLANLENTKNRQAEREENLKREADHQKHVNQLLMVLIALVSLAALLAVAFARYRNKISKKLAIKTAQAEDADRMKSEFLGMVSHELRTPLNGIVGIADLLSTQAPTEGLRHKAGIILDSSNKLTHVIESIVDMSTIDGDKMELYPEPTDIHSIVTDLDQLWRPVIEQKGVTFTSFVEGSLVDDIILDSTRFRQCLDNLLSNAAKFTDSGRIHLHITSKLIPDTNETEVTAIIADTGQGMSEEVQDKLFTPFLQADSTMTRKHGGSGLGLAITQSLARMMGGDVTMVSALNRGSEFTLTVRGEKSDASQILDDVERLMDTLDMTPAIKMSEPKPQSQALQPHYQMPTDDLRGLKVLIVEDIPANQDIIKLFLEPEGCQNQCVSNGREALDVLNTQNIDVILMDIRMPEMDGITATREIRNSGREYKAIPIIALTADASAETNAACMAAGADIFLNKPVMARDVIEAIRFIRRFQEHDENNSSNVA